MAAKNLRIDGNPTIELYRSNDAVPEDLNAFRFWVVQELRRIQAMGYSTEDVLRRLSVDIENLDGAGGTPGEKGEPGRDGSPGIPGEKGDPGQDGQDANPEDLIADGERRSDRTWSSQKIDGELDEKIGRVEEDSEPKLGGDLLGEGYKVSGVQTLNLAGRSTDYTAIAAESLIRADSDHTYNYTNVIIPEAFYWGGTHTLTGNGLNILTGALFRATGTIKNENGTAILLGPYYTVVGQNTYQADNAVVTQSDNINFYSLPNFNGINGGAFTCADMTHFGSSIVIGAGATITANYAFKSSLPLSGGGVIVGHASFCDVGFNSATNNTALLTGTATIPIGNWNVYQANGRLNRWNGGHIRSTRTVSATTSVSAADDVVHIVGAVAPVTITLPAITATLLGRTITFKNLSGVSVTLQRSGSNTIDILATSVVLGFAEAYTFQVQSASNWSVIGRVQ